MESVQVRPVSPETATALTRLLHEEVIDRLRDMIVQGELAPGTKLNERVLAEQLGISRTPLREAIKYLASEGLVELLPNRGAMVAPLESERVTGRAPSSSSFSTVYWATLPLPDTRQALPCSVWLRVASISWAK